MLGKVEPCLKCMRDWVEVLDQVQMGLLSANHQVNTTVVEGFHTKVRALFENFYYAVKDAVLKEDSLKQFYMDLYGHVDGSLRELARSKAAQVFKPEVRQAATKKTQDKPITGLLDGDENLAEKLSENNKVTDLIAKVTVSVILLVIRNLEIGHSS